MPFGCEFNLACVKDVALYQLFMNFIRYYPIAGAAFVIFYIWKKDYFARFRIQEKYPKTEKILHELRQSALTLVIFAAIGTTVYVLKRMNILDNKIYRDPSLYGGVPYMILSYILLTVWHETWFYWAHRLMHHKKIYKYVHLTHHQSVNPTPIAAYHFHWREAILEGICPVIFFMFVPMYFPVFVIHTFHVMILNIWWHLGYELFPKGFASHPILKWINTSTHHNMHHQKFNGNYSLYFNFWDRVMGTNFPNYEKYYDEVTAKRDIAEPVQSQEEVSLGTV
ncbi:MAG TPA: sterol desaturase family protein [Leptospiraceae bacterium]|nr:sterol desaturase family protein [Leptospiraceae bacterium]